MFKILIDRQTSSKCAAMNLNSKKKKIWKKIIINHCLKTYPTNLSKSDTFLPPDFTVFFFKNSRLIATNTNEKKIKKTEKTKKKSFENVRKINNAQSMNKKKKKGEGVKTIFVVRSLFRGFPVSFDFPPLGGAGRRPRVFASRNLFFVLLFFFLYIIFLFCLFKFGMSEFIYLFFFVRRSTRTWSSGRGCHRPLRICC